MLWRIFHGLCTNPAGRTLVAGAIGVLAGVECLMSSRTHATRRKISQPQVTKTQPSANAPAVPARPHYLRIYRTKSELGYVYWVVQGFGCYKCFLLLDTWNEAMAEAEERLRGVSVPDHQLVTAVSRT